MSTSYSTIVTLLIWIYIPLIWLAQASSYTTTDFTIKFTRYSLYSNFRIDYRYGLMLDILKKILIPCVQFFPVYPGKQTQLYMNWPLHWQVAIFWHGEWVRHILVSNEKQWIIISKLSDVMWMINMSDLW